MLPKRLKSEKQLRSKNLSESESSNGGFTQVANCVIKDASLNSQARFLYVLLSSYAWDKDFSFPSQEKLAENMGLTARQVRNLLKKLESAHYTKIIRRGFEVPNFYILKKLPPGKRYRKRYNELFRKREE